MTDMEIQLRGAMDDLADDAPSAEGLLDAVHRRGRTVQRRRVVLGVVAVVAVVLVGSSLLTLGGRDEAVERLKVATPGPSAVSGSASPRPATDLGKAPSPQVDFGWLPDGFPEPTVRLLGPGAWGLDTRRDEGLAALQLQIMAAEPKVRTSPGELTDVDLKGSDGKLYWVPVHAAGDPKWGHTPPEAEGPYAELSFQRQPGQWIRLILQNSAGDVDTGITRDDLVKIATSLVEKERPVPDAIRIGAVPAGLTWGTLTNDDYRTGAGFVDADVRPQAVSQEEQPNGHNGSVATSLSVSIFPADALEITLYLPNQDPGNVTIPGGTTVTKLDGRTSAITTLRSNPKLAVVVSANDDLGISDADLTAMAETTEPGPDAAVKPAR
ncbi:hypothetical protein [Cryptosporangium sp. NPDC048952]|uniref:hypothetical protein n=1 Tax=Cryptosporangium sp. NPDC048952 TaxID=3363961 RepID=UPI003721D24A